MKNAAGDKSETSRGRRILEAHAEDPVQSWAPAKKNNRPTGLFLTRYFGQIGQRLLAGGQLESGPSCFDDSEESVWSNRTELHTNFNKYIKKRSIVTVPHKTLLGFEFFRFMPDIRVG